ncbi:hypothetical protein Tco_0099320 [Tanacetum coccineum]
MIHCRKTNPSSCLSFTHEVNSPRESIPLSKYSGNDGLIIDDAFQEGDKELEYVEHLDEEAEQVTYVVQQTLCSPKGLALKVPEIYKEFQAKRKETRVSYGLVVKGIEDVMENAIPAVVKPLLDEFGKIVADDTSNALPPLRNI